MRFDNKVRISLGSRSTFDIRQLKRKLICELDQVRSLKKKLDAKESQSSNVCNVDKTNDNMIGANRVGTLARVNSEVSYVGSANPRPVQGLTGSLDDIGSNYSHARVGGSVDKEKKTPKLNQKKSSDFVNEKVKFAGSDGKKKPKPNSGGKKDNGGEVFGFVSGRDRFPKELFKMCGDVLGYLMKHEYGWVFNTPVDAKKLKLHDYHKIIKRPMDLGTVKRKLNENLYKSPTEFAEDVRLTFKNAITYNEKGQDVHFMAQVLLKIFEERWAVVKTKFKFDRRPEARNSAISPSKDIPNSCSSAPIHDQSTIAVPPVQVPSEKRKLDRLEASAVSVHSKSSTGNTDTILKKPKAASAEIRDMTYEEKHRLSIDLQNLASDKLDSVVQIIRRRNPGLFRQEDEIEVDIESFDAETLWELNSFVTKYKDSLSKSQKNGEYALKGACTNVKETSMISAAGEAFKGPEAGTIEGENASGSSHSGSSSSDTGSSSSGSDSDSSSGCGSDGGQ